MVGTSGAAALALWGATILTGVYFMLRDKALRRLLLIVLAWMAVNIVLHWYWQYRGSVYLYGAHSAFALFVVLVVGYAKALQTLPATLTRSLMLCMIALTAWNNLGLYKEMIAFLIAQPHG